MLLTSKVQETFSPNISKKCKHILKIVTLSYSYTYLSIGLMNFVWENVDKQLYMNYF